MSYIALVIPAFFTPETKITEIVNNYIKHHQEKVCCQQFHRSIEEIEIFKNPSYDSEYFIKIKNSGKSQYN